MSLELIRHLTFKFCLIQDTSSNLQKVNHLKMDPAFPLIGAEIVLEEQNALPAENTVWMLTDERFCPFTKSKTEYLA